MIYPVIYPVIYLNYKVKARLSVSLLFCLCKIHIVSWYLTFIRGTSLCIASCLDNCCNRLAFIKSHSNSLLKSSTDHYFTIISHKYILLLYNFFHKVAKYSQLRIKEGSWETNKPTYLRFIKAQRSGVRVWERENKKRERKRKEKERLTIRLDSWADLLVVFHSASSHPILSRSPCLSLPLSPFIFYHFFACWCFLFGCPSLRAFVLIISHVFLQMQHKNSRSNF